MTWMLSILIRDLGRRKYRTEACIFGLAGDVASAVAAARDVQVDGAAIDGHGHRVIYRMTVSDGQREVANLGL